MAEDVNVSNFPDSGSPARVAYDFMRYLNRSGVKPEAGGDMRKFLLDLYAECLDATNGYRKVK
ncbi:hypothetical protein ACFPIF_02430 [Brevundimonas faecalis]|uniref:hypothetical protein n=1 Tax=Brevundimonas faecalis TaxID=947378 RepID=UPI00360F53B3